MDSRIFLILTSTVLILGNVGMDNEIWWEQTGKKYSYKLSNYNFLIILGHDFDYLETMLVKKFWEDWGAKVAIAGFNSEISGHIYKKTDEGWDCSEKRKLKIDLLVRDVNISDYNVLFFPGGSSPDNLISKDSNKIANITKKAYDEGLIIAGICHGPKIIAASGIVKNRKVTGHRDIRKVVLDAGGEFVEEISVVDDKIVTCNWPYFETMAVKVAESLLYPEGDAPSDNSPFISNPVLKNIRECRSVRVFRDKNISKDTINLILEAATWAPSANNKQPWRFIVSRDKKTKRRLMETMMIHLEKFYEENGISAELIKSYWENIFKAPVLIFIFCEHNEIHDECINTQKFWDIQGASLASLNIILASKSLGLGSLWMGVTLLIEKEIKDILDVPEDIKLITTIAIGYPEHEPLPQVRNHFSRVTFYEKWNKR